MDARTNGNKTPTGERTPLQVFEVPIELYLFLKKAGKISFTASQLRKQFNKAYNETVRTDRVRQICEALADRGHIQRTEEPHPVSNNLCTFYTASEVEPVAVDSEIFKLAETIEKIGL